MNKSLEYMIEITKDKDRCRLDAKSFDDAMVVNSKELFLNAIKKQTSAEIKLPLQLLLGDVKSEIDFDNSAEFDYFTTTIITHDGTSIFTRDAILGNFQNVMNVATYYKPTTPQEALDNKALYKWYYTLGDTIIHSDFGMKVINGHKMLGQTDTVCLPIKFRVEKL